MIWSEEELLFPDKFTYCALDDESMAPQIPCGATVTIRNVDNSNPMTEIDPRQIYYIQINSLIKVIRYMIRIGNKVILLSNNKRLYPAEIYDLSETRISVLGTVCSWYCEVF